MNSLENIKKLPLEKCHEILTEIIMAIYGCPDADTMEAVLDPDNEFTCDTIEDVCSVLEQHDLIPDGIIDL